MKLCLPSTPAVVLTLLAASLAAQTRIRTIDGDSAGDLMGRAVHSAGDVNGDGRTDFIIGAPNDDDRGANSGSARVYSGATGGVLHFLRGTRNNDQFGRSAGGAGDVNGDGFADVIVGAIGDIGTGSAWGSARVFSGRDGALLHLWYGLRQFTFYGETVRGAGDIDADGYDDLIVGVPPIFGTGNAVTYSGQTGSLVDQFLVLGTGEVVDGAGDVNGDGFADVVVGRPNDEVIGFLAGSAAVFSGRDRTVLWQIDGQPLDNFGASVAKMGDVNGDGFDDVAVGAIQILSGLPGYVSVVSGSDGSVIYRVNGAIGGDQFGTSIGSGGDVDGDGIYDLVVGAPGSPTNGAESGSASVFSGATGARLAVLLGDSAGDRFGSAVDLLPRLSLDGFADVIVGAPQDDDNGVDAGRAFVYDLDFTGIPGDERVYGRGCPSSNGHLPRIDPRGDASIGSTLQARLRGALGNTLAVMLLGLRVNVPIDNLGAPNCILYVDLATSVSLSQATDADGLARLDLHMPANTGLVGARINGQWVVVDLAANSLGLVASDGMRLTLGQ